MPRRVGVIVLSSLAILALSAGLLFTYGLSPWIKRALVKALPEATKGLYHFEKLRVEIRPFNGSVALTGVEISWDSLAYQHLVACDSAPANLISAQIPDIELRLQQPWNLWSGKPLVVDNIRIRDPLITLIHLKSPGPNPGFARLAQTWMASLVEKFSSVTISHVEISGGELRFNNDRQFSQDAFVAKDLKAEVSDFSFDERTVKRKKKPFRMGNFTVNVGLEDYSYILADSTYEIRAARMGFSSEQDEVFAEQVQLRPNYRKRNSPSGNAKKTGNLYELRIERVLLGGLNLQEWMSTSYLSLGALRLAHPELIQVTSGDNTSDTLNPANLLAQLQPIAKGLSIRGISIDRGSYRRIPGVGDTTGSVRIDGLGAYLQDFRIDSQSVLQNRIILSEETELRADGFELILNQGKYRLTGGTSYLSTPERRAFIQSVALHSQGKNAPSESQTDLVLSRIEVDGLDVLQAVRSRSLSLKRLKFTEPKLTLVTPKGQKSEPADSVATQGITALLSPWYDEISIADFDVVSGIVKFRQPATGNSLDAHELSVRISQFAFKATKPGDQRKPLTAASLDITAQVDSAKFSTEDGKLDFSLEGISWSTEDSLLTIKELGIVQEEKTGSGNAVFRLHAPNISLRGWDAHEALFRRKLLMERLSIDSATVSLLGTGKQMNAPDGSWQYPDLSPWLGNYFDTVSIHVAEARNIRLTYPNSADNLETTAPFLLRLRTINWNPESPHEIGSWWYAEEAFLAVGAGKIGPLTVESAHFSTLTRNFEACQVQLKDSTSSWLIPNLSIKKIDWERYLVKQQLHVRSLLMDMPKFALNAPTEKDTLVDKAILWSKISPYLSLLTFDSLKVAEASADVEVPKQPPLQIRNLNALIRNVSVDSTSFVGEGVPFSFGDYDLDLDINGYTWNMPDSVYQLSVGQIGFSSSDSLFYTANLHLQPRPNADVNGAQAIWDINAPRLVVKGLNLAEVINDKKINLRSLVIGTPVIQWKVLNEDDQPFEEAITASFQKLLNRFGKISVGELKIQHGSLVRERLDRPGSQPTILPDFSLALMGFAPDRQEALRPGRFLYASDVMINVHRFEYPIQQGEYLATIHEMTFRAKAGTLTSDSVIIRPVLGNYTYILLHGYAIDSLVVKFHDLRLEKLQSLNFLARGALKADMFTIGDLDLSIFRDRRYPPKPDRHPPMPQDLLRRAVIPIDVDSFQLKNGTFSYEEMVEGWEKSGKLTLDSLMISFSGVSNIQGSADQARMHATARLMGTTPFDLQVEFPLNDTSDSYRLVGFIGAMPMTALNPILSTAAYIQIRTGYAEKMEFTLIGNKHLVTGKMRYYYDGLKLTMFDRKGKSEDVPSRKGLLSALANSLVVRSKNPNKRFLRVGRIRYTPEPSRFITGMWIKAISQGALSSLGITSKDERDKILETKHRK